MHLFVSFTLLCCLFGFSFEQKSKKCKEKLDVGLIFQNPSKQSIRNLYSTFLHNAKQKLVEGNPCIRMAVILASRDPQLLIKLSCGYSNRGRCYRSGSQKLSRASPGFGDLGKAVDLLQNVALSTRNGGRIGSKQIAVLLLTSIPGKNEMSPMDAVKDILDSGIEVMAVGAGEALRLPLKKVSLSDSRTLRFTSLEKLRSVDTASTFALFVKGDLPPLPQAAAFSRVAEPPIPLMKAADLKDQCTYFAEIGFLVDSSGSVRDDYDKEKFFVRRIATKFNISEAGSHGGVILFSSKGYVTLSIKLNQYTRLKDFNEAVEKLYFYGYQTRIDLALDLADNSMFTPEGGMRPNIKRVLILITDGRQNPFIDPVTRDVYDPASNAVPLHNRDTQIFAVGIGKRINNTELERITRDKENVYNVNNFDELISDEFVKRVSAKFCSPGIKEKVNATEKPGTTAPNKGPCTGTSSCCGSGSGCCCGRGPVYINIFNGNHNTVLQGLTVSGTGGGSVPIYNGVPGLGSNQTRLSSGTYSEVAKWIKSIFPDKASLAKVVQELSATTPNRGPPGTQVPIFEINRRRRSLIETANIQNRLRATYDLLSPLQPASLSGWGHFSVLFNEDLSSLLLRFGTKENLTLLVPSDAAIAKLKQHHPEQVQKFMSEAAGVYMVTPLDDMWSYLKSVGGSQILRSYIDVSSEDKQGILTIENAKVVRQQHRMPLFTSLLMDSILDLPKVDLLSAMDRNPKLSIFTRWFRRSGMYNIMKNLSIPSSFCLDQNTCLPLDDKLKTRLKTIIAFHQFTIFAPSNDAIKMLPKSEIQKLIINKERLQHVLGSHIVIGTIFSKSINHQTRSISPSLTEKNIVHMVSRQAGQTYMQYSDMLQRHSANVMETDERATNGILHVVDKIFVA